MPGYSQNGEESHILHYFEVMGIKKGHLVDLGAGDGYTMSNTRALLEKGWTGDLYDGDPKGAKDVIKQWITREAVKALVDCRCDFLNLDLDGNDYWILAELMDNTSCWPRLIVCEFNPIFERHEAVAMPYNGTHQWAGDTYYGASLAAFEKLLGGLYTLAHVHAGINAFFLRDDHAKAHPELIRPIDYKVKRDHKPHPPEKQWQRL